MLRTASPLFLGLATFIPYAAAGFGFTSPDFEYVQLSSSQTISWNGQQGDVELRLMVYPATQELSYLPIASNITANSYTWLPTSISPNSQWTLEGVDSAGNIASTGQPFTIQGTIAPGPNGASTSLLQQNPQTTAQSTSTAPSQSSTPSTTSQTTSAPSSTNTFTPPPDNGTPTSIKVAVFVGVLFGIAGIVSLATFFILQKRAKRRRALAATNLAFELHNNDSIEDLPKPPPMELQGSHIEGLSRTNLGYRTELAPSGSSRLSTGKRVSMAPGAVETSMGKRFELS